MFSVLVGIFCIFFDIGPDLYRTSTYKFVLNIVIITTSTFSQYLKLRKLNLAGFFLFFFSTKDPRTRKLNVVNRLHHRDLFDFNHQRILTFWKFSFKLFHPIIIPRLLLLDCFFFFVSSSYDNILCYLKTRGN